MCRRLRSTNVSALEGSRSRTIAMGSQHTISHILLLVRILRHSQSSNSTLPPRPPPRLPTSRTSPKFHTTIRSTNTPTPTSHRTIPAPLRTCALPSPRITKRERLERLLVLLVDRAAVFGPRHCFAGLVDAGIADAARGGVGEAVWVGFGGGRGRGWGVGAEDFFYAGAERLVGFCQYVFKPSRQYC